MLALDVLLLLMIVVCIVYCWILNQRIRDLHNSRVEFARMIKEFDAAVAKAENCISELSVLGKTATDQLRVVSEEADDLVHELKTVYDIGNKLGEKLEKSIMEARKQVLNLETAASKTSKRKKKTNEDSLFVEDNGSKTFMYEEEMVAFTNNGGYSEDELLPEHKSLLETVLNKITTHRQKGTLDQTSYYDSLRKVSVRK